MLNDAYLFLICIETVSTASPGTSTTGPTVSTVSTVAPETVTSGEFVKHKKHALPFI